ncbi:ABC transporter ATP-binding protein [Candidatus Bipolaricaulota bacterium]|nr:ABC transporter ATP-binding protein [Candidatus Bipolaricaulota bacterium]MBS3813841.1 ABC transporter ATP-binding protein [Candidatus Bipolaricaulota bacterium]MBS3824960.1 ABC transporter ATP-binding protein [Candidatus Bipolaricaulota bacterium]
MPLIELNDLKTYFYTEDGVVKAVDGVTFSIDKQQTLGVVGESGCGKSVTALSIMGLVPMPPGKIEGGEILFHRNGEPVDLTKLNPKGREIRSIRGNEIAMIFQEPMTSLNPVFTIGNQIMEAITLHQDVNKGEARTIAIQMLEEVGIPLPAQRVDEYPHQLSGGMRQRAMIAMALSCNPTMLIADEPTTALDVTIQAQILELMGDLQDEFDTSIMFITHDLGVIAEITSYVVVMYLGKIVESGDVHEIYKDPTMPYTQGLMESIPSLDVDKGRLEPIKGVVPDPYEVPEGCPFNNRCPHVMDICKEEDPPLEKVGEDHKSSCWLHIDH